MEECQICRYLQKNDPNYIVHIRVNDNSGFYLCNTCFDIFQPECYYTCECSGYDCKNDESSEVFSKLEKLLFKRYE